VIRALAAALAAVLAGASQTDALQTNVIATHDNLKPAGRMDSGELRIALWAGAGAWSPQGPKGKVRQVAAFGEDGGSLSIPSPLIRVVEGTTVVATVRNALTEALRIHGLCERPGPCAPVDLEPGQTREVRFKPASAGTFHYWAAVGGAPIDARDDADSQLGGALIVDPPGAVSRDRVFVMGLMVEGTGDAAADLAVINGRSWPYTERLTYTTGEAARWRVINLTASPHAMHLHGFYYRVDSIGDGVRDTIYAEDQRRQSVTEQMPPARTMTITWTPERAGNWLFHCHMLGHMMPPGDHHDMPGPPPAPDPNAAGMAGLVLGIRVTGTAAGPSSTGGVTARRPLQFLVEPDGRNGATPSYKVSVTNRGQPAARINTDRAVPGPVLLLERGEPVAVEIVNRLTEPTAIHWHGIELESYDDGVPGFGGTAGSVTPPVAPGGTFTARFTPPRAGTFIYHTHWHNASQLAGGIYGPLIVLEPGERFDPERDHVIVVGLDGANRPFPNEPIVVNGDAKPRPLDLKAGVSHRLRFINITPDNVALTFQLVSRFDPIQWTLVAKDGSAVPAAQRTPRPARQLVTVGETYDFEIAALPPTPVGLWLELRRGSGELLKQWPVQVKELRD
jgi:FtsP/CotA-like multicopper oxidase with cupredoxin domain